MPIHIHYWCRHGTSLWHNPTEQTGDLMKWHINCRLVVVQPMKVSLQTHLFGPLKQALRSRRFTTDQLLDVTVHLWLVSQPKSFYSEGIKQTVQWWTKCIVKQGDYVEILCSCKISALVFVNIKCTLRIIIDSPSYVECLLASSVASRQSTQLARQIPIAVYAVLRLLMTDSRSVRNM